MIVLVASRMIALSSFLILLPIDLKAQSKFENFRETLEHVKIMDGPYLEGSKQDKDFIENYVQNSWMDISKNIDKFSNLQQRKIITSAMDNLEDSEYLEFSVVFLGLLKDGKIDILSGKYLLMPNESKEGFLAINYKDEKLNFSLSEVRELFRNDADYLQFIDSILCGRAKDDFLKFREGTGLKARLPVINRKSISETETIKDEKVPESESKNNVRKSKILIEESVNTKDLNQKPIIFSAWLLPGSIAVLILAIVTFYKVRKSKLKP